MTRLLLLKEMDDRNANSTLIARFRFLPDDDEQMVLEKSVTRQDKISDVVLFRFMQDPSGSDRRCAGPRAFTCVQYVCSREWSGVAVKYEVARALIER